MKFSILSWGAWSPKHQKVNEWKAWTQTSNNNDFSQSPEIPHVPAMQRRRLSRLTKMFLNVASQANIPPQTRTIFSSQHGEINRTIALLNNIVAAEPLSPISFSQSVHNTASGIFSILSNNTAASTSIAAGNETLSQSLVEAYGLLAQDPSPIALLYGDEPVPKIYSEFASEPEWPIAIAFMLAPANHPDSVAEIDLDLAQIDTQEQHTPATLGYGQLLSALANNRAITGVFSNKIWSLTPHDR